jgi:predicted Zn-dependent peptidase
VCGPFRPITDILELFMTQRIESFRLPNGLLVVFEPMRDVQSAALSLLVPAGGVRDAAGRCGTASILGEMFTRGADGLSSRELCAALDNLGLQRSFSVGSAHITFSAATTADRLSDALPLISRMITRPHLTDEDFEPARDLIAQGLMSLEDEPRQRLGKVLRQHSYPAPWGNSSEGELTDLETITPADVRRHFQAFVTPCDAILGIAGNLDFASLKDSIQAVFSEWRGPAIPPVTAGSCPVSPYHLPHDSAQTHLGLAWDTVTYSDERYYEAWAAVSLLSGGMSSRLFTEVREKRGLCYAISASLSTLKDQARVMAYAGTTSERAQETLEVTVAEVLRLHEGITEDELQRCKARAKSSLIMQQESTSSRASSLARDMYLLGRVVTLDEIHHRIDSLNVPQVQNFIQEYAPRSMVLVTIGPQPLNADCVSRLA